MELINPIKNYMKDVNCVYSCQYHIIFCTKYKRRVLDFKIQQRLKQLLLEQQEKYDFKIINIDILENYVHLLISSNPKQNINTLVSNLKDFTAKILKNEFSSLKTRIPCLWTNSKFISTIGNIDTNAINSYINSQVIN